MRPRLNKAVDHLRCVKTALCGGKMDYQHYVMADTQTHTCAPNTFRCQIVSVSVIKVHQTLKSLGWRVAVNVSVCVNASKRRSVTEHAFRPRPFNQSFTQNRNCENGPCDMTQHNQAQLTGALWWVKRLGSPLVYFIHPLDLLSHIW